MCDESPIYIDALSIEAEIHDDESPIHIDTLSSEEEIHDDESPISETEKCFSMTFRHANVPSHHHRLRGESMDAIDR